MSQNAARMYCPPPRAREAKAIPRAGIHRHDGRRRHFRASSCCGAAVGKLVCWGISFRVSAALKVLQHFFLNLLDLVFHGTDAIQGTAKSLSFLNDLIDFGQDVAQLGMEFDQRSSPFVASLPRSGSGIANLSRLKEKLRDLLFIAEQELADGIANLLVFSGIAPEHVFEEEQISFKNFCLSFQVGTGLE